MMYIAITMLMVVIVLALLLRLSEQAAPPTQKIRRWKRQRKCRRLRRTLFNHIRGAVPAMQWDWTHTENRFGDKHKSRHRDIRTSKTHKEMAESERKKRAQLEEEAAYIWYIGDENGFDNNGGGSNEEEEGTEDIVDLDVNSQCT